MTSTAAPSSPTTAVETTAAATTAPPTPRVLRAGEVLGVPFGTPESEALSRLTEILGSPSEPTATALGGGVGNYRTFGSLTVLFFESTLGAGDRTLSGWLVDAPDGSWITDTGIAPGSTEAAVLSAYPAATVTNEDECGNAPFVLGDEIEFSLDPAGSRTVDGIGSPWYGFC